MASEIAADAAIEPTPTIATMRLESAPPKSARMIAPAKENAGTSQSSCSTLTLQQAGGIDIERFIEVVQPQHQREAHRDLGGGHGQDEQEHHLSVGLAPTRSRGHKTEAGRIEHHLNRHQREYYVAAGQQSGQPQRE